MWLRHLRAAIVVALGVFFVIGPAQSQVLLLPGRSQSAPWRPMTWHMYHSVGLENCQGEFYFVRDGKRFAYPHEELARILPRIRGGGNSRWDAGRHVRTFDVVWNTTHTVTEIGKLICASEPTHADVRAVARCAPSEPGRWVEVADGSINLCDAP